MRGCLKIFTGPPLHGLCQDKTVPTRLREAAMIVTITFARDPDKVLEAFLPDGLFGTLSLRDYNHLPLVVFQMPNP